MVDQITGSFPEAPRPQPTGRTLVLFHADADLSSVQRLLSKKTGAKTRDRRDFAGAATALNATVDLGESVFFHRQKIAILPASDKAQIMALASDDSVQSVRPEFYMFTIDDLRERHAAWVREGLKILVEQFGAAPVVAAQQISALETRPRFSDNNDVTWGLQATGVSTSRFTGAGIKIAVLDTGIDLTHPDFAGRTSIKTKSFVDGETVQDGQGHGTHTAGTIAGPKVSGMGRRYGVAPDVELFVGKVLNNSGVGRESDIIDAMNWAIDEKCVAISMSLGRATSLDEKPDQNYERTGASALRENCLIIAAAGNESARDSGYIAPVGAPANSNSVMAVAAVDPVLNVAPFSCGGLVANGGEVNISGPGVSVYSSFPVPRQSRMLQGTSMACPHVAGIAALWAQSDSSLRGEALRDALIRAAKPLGNARDYGSGLAQCPDSGLIA